MVWLSCKCPRQVTWWNQSCLGQQHAKLFFLNGTWHRLWSAIVSHRGTAILWQRVLHDVDFFPWVVGGWYRQLLHIPILWNNAVSAGYLVPAYFYVLPPLVKKDRRQNDWAATLSHLHTGVIKSSVQQLLHFLIININNAPVNRNWWNVSGLVSRLFQPHWTDSKAAVAMCQTHSCSRWPHTCTVCSNSYFW